jgi:hypothetical protein
MTDLRDIASGYAVAILAMLALFALAAAAPQWFFRDGALAGALRVLLAIGLYVGSGAPLLAFAARRIAGWNGVWLVPMRPVRWYTFLAWPLLVGVMLYRIAQPQRV